MRRIAYRNTKYKLIKNTNSPLHIHTYNKFLRFLVIFSIELTELLMLTSQYEETDYDIQGTYLICMQYLLEFQENWFFLDPIQFSREGLQGKISSERVSGPLSTITHSTLYTLQLLQTSKHNIIKNPSLSAHFYFPKQDRKKNIIHFFFAWGKNFGTK